jgi:hypothetical protein
LFVMLTLAVVTLLLVRSMRQHLRRVPPRFDPPDGPGAGTELGEDGPGGSADPSRR